MRFDAGYLTKPVALDPVSSAGRGGDAHWLAVSGPAAANCPASGYCGYGEKPYRKQIWPQRKASQGQLWSRNKKPPDASRRRHHRCLHRRRPSRSKWSRLNLPLRPSQNLLCRKQKFCQISQKRCQSQHPNLWSRQSRNQSQRLRLSRKQ